MHTVKPLDKVAVVKAAKETGALITVEEHNLCGGLGSTGSGSIDGRRFRQYRIPPNCLAGCQRSKNRFSELAS